MMGRKATTIALDPSMGLQQLGDDGPQSHGPVVEEIEGLIKVFKDGFVLRPQIVPFVSSSLLPCQIDVASQDAMIDRFSDVWVRFYVPTCRGKYKFNKKLPLVVYFHGGGFCVGSPAWSCYHKFLARLALEASICIASVNYRLAPENPLPAAYDDGFRFLKWLKQQALLSCNLLSPSREWWMGRCDFSRVFLAGDSAGANIAHHLAVRLASNNAFEALSLSPLGFKGTFLLQPFFGGEERTESEKNLVQPPRSALCLATADTYWRLALPSGANRDHPWCNPVMTYNQASQSNLEDLMLPPTMVCISGKDILRDRNLQFCHALVAAGKVVEHVVYEGVGHAFQVLSKSQVAQARTEEMLSHIRSFVNR